MRRATARSDHPALIVRGAIAIVVIVAGAAACGKTAPASDPGGTLLPPVVVPVASAKPAEPAPVEQGIVVELGAGGHVRLDGMVVPEDGLRAAFASKPAGEMVVIRAAKDEHWGRVVRVLDLMKQAKNGNHPFVLAVKDDATKRTTVLDFPEASELMSVALPPKPDRGGAPSANLVMRHAPVIIGVTILRDGTRFLNNRPLEGSLRDRLKDALARAPDARVVVNAAPATPFEVIVETTRDAQSEGAKIAFGVEAPRPAIVDGADMGNAAGPAAVTSASTTSASTAKPRTKNFGACPFPPAADNAAVDTAVVALKVSVDATGKATNVTVIAHPGHGFAAEAKACALKATYEPARDPAGKSIAADAVIHVRFQR